MVHADWTKEPAHTLRRCLPNPRPPIRNLTNIVRDTYIADLRIHKIHRIRNLGHVL